MVILLHYVIIEAFEHSQYVHDVHDVRWESSSARKGQQKACCIWECAGQRNCDSPRLRPKLNKFQLDPVAVTKTIQNQGMAIFPYFFPDCFPTISLLFPDFFIFFPDDFRFSFR